jgi:hypothetical protein
MTPESALDVLVASVPRGYGFVSAIVKLNGDKPANVRCVNDDDDWYRDEVDEAIVALAETAKATLTRKPFNAQLEFNATEGETREVDIYVTKITNDVWLVEVLDDVIRPPAEENPAGAGVEAVKEASEDPK